MSISKEEFEKLEKRVKAIEKKLGINMDEGKDGKFVMPEWIGEYRKLMDELIPPLIEKSKLLGKEVETIVFL